MPKLSVDFGDHISEDSHKNQYPSPSVILVLLHHNTVTNVDQIYRCCDVSFSLVTHTQESPARSSDSCSGWFVWNRLPRVGFEA